MKKKGFLISSFDLPEEGIGCQDLGAKALYLSPILKNEDNCRIFIGYDQQTISIQSIMITRDLAGSIFESQQRDFQRTCDRLSTGELQMGFRLKNSVLNLTVSVVRKKGSGRNTLGWIRSKEGSKTDRKIVIGAHLDHIGYGKASSRAKKSQKGKMHPGADDNASGIGALLEIAEYLADLRRKGLLKSNYDILFAAWSGEEIGLVGSSYFMRAFPSTADERREILAYLNLDMVGRYQEKLTIHGVGSSTGWRKLIQRANVPVGLNLNLQNDSLIPRDRTSFFSIGIPILSAFTGLHPDYHSPSDTADKINYQGVSDCSKLYSRLIQLVKKSDYVSQAPPKSEALSVYLGTIPDYSQTDQKGVLLQESAKVDQQMAGMQSEDVIIELEGKKLNLSTITPMQSDR